MKKILVGLCLLASIASSASESIVLKEQDELLDFLDSPRTFISQLIERNEKGERKLKWNAESDELNKRIAEDIVHSECSKRQVLIGNSLKAITLLFYEKTNSGIKFEIQSRFSERYDCSRVLSIDNNMILTSGEF